MPVGARLKAKTVHELATALDDVQLGGEVAMLIFVQVDNGEWVYIGQRGFSWSEAITYAKGIPRGLTAIEREGKG